MTIAASEQSTDDGIPVELYRFLVGPASAPPVPGETADAPLSNDLSQYVFSPSTATSVLQVHVTGAGVITSPTMGASTLVASDWGVAGMGYNGTQPVDLYLARAGTSGPGYLELKYYNKGFNSQYFGGLYAFQVVSGFTVGQRYETAAILNVNWNFLDPNIQGPCGWGLFAVNTGDATGWPCDSSCVNADGTIGGSFIARDTQYEVRFSFNYGNSNWNTTAPYPRVISFKGFVITPITSADDDAAPDPTVYRFTSADEAIVYAAETYSPANLLRSPFRVGGDEASNAEATLEIERDHALVDIAGVGPPQFPVAVMVLRLHRSDLSVAATPWRGQVVGAGFSGGKGILRMKSARGLLTRKVPRFLTQQLCGNNLFDQLCKASRVVHTRGPFNISAIAGDTVVADGAATAQSGRLTGFQFGLLVAPSGLIVSILDTNGDTLILKQPVPGLIVGDDVTLVFGCNKKLSTCARDFHNTVNHNGESVLPLQNPGEGAGLAGGTATTV